MLDLRTLIGHSAFVQADQLVETVQAEFARTNTDFLAVLEGTSLLGVCARRELVQALGTRFGFSLNARQPFRSQLMPAPMQVILGTPVTEVFKVAATRTDREFFDDVLLVDEQGRYLGLIPMRTLVRLQTDFLLGNIVTLEASRQEIAAKNGEMEKDLLMAREVQLAMLPSLYEPLDADGLTLAIAHRFLPAGGVSGDFFDVLRLPDNAAGILVCDVMGHGVRSALVTAMVRAIAQELKSIAGQPGDFLTRLNRDLTSILRQTKSLIFVTAVYLVVDLRSRQLRYARAGHPNPLRLDPRSRTMIPLPSPMDADGPALGLMDEFDYVTTSASIAPGDRIALYTDGVTEAPSLQGEEFGETRLADCLTQTTTQPVDAALSRLVDELTSYCGSTVFPDDVCVVAVEILANPQAGDGV